MIFERTKIYQAVESLAFVEDSLFVTIELPGGNTFSLLFLQLAASANLTQEMISEAKSVFRDRSHWCGLPDVVIQAPLIPYTDEGEKMENAVKELLMGVPIQDVMGNYEGRDNSMLDFFIDFPLQKSAAP